MWKFCKETRKDHLSTQGELSRAYVFPGQVSNVVKKENPATAPESMQQRTTVRMGGRHINAVPCRCAAQNTSGCTLQANRQLKIHSKVENGKQQTCETPSPIRYRDHLVPWRSVSVFGRTAWLFPLRYMAIHHAIVFER